MSLLPVLSVLLLVAVAVWFFWPVMADPITRLSDRREDGSDADNEADHLFEAWSRHGYAVGEVRNGRV